MATEKETDPALGILNDAAEALSRGDCAAAVIGATTLVEIGEPWLVDALYRRAMALESWKEGPPDRLVSAFRDWHRLVELGPASVSFRGLARVQLKLGDRDAALQNLIEAERRARTPEVLLGFAEYYRTASPPDLLKAKAFYLSAAVKGRTQGMRGYVEVAMELDQPFAAYAMVIFSLASTPFLAVAMGDRRHAGF